MVTADFSGFSAALRFFEWSRTRAHAPALICPDATLSYGELAPRAGGIRRGLSTEGVLAQPAAEQGALEPRPIAVAGYHDASTYAAVLALLWEKHAHVPLHPRY